MGGGEMGHLDAPGVYNTPDPDEYVRIAGDLLKPRNGRYELRVTNELEEAMFFDHLQLVAVAHPRRRRNLSKRRTDSSGATFQTLHVRATRSRP